MILMMEMKLTPVTRELRKFLRVHASETFYFFNAFAFFTLLGLVSISF